jgi:hypothetical protein
MADPAEPGAQTPALELLDGAEFAIFFTPDDFRTGGSAAVGAKLWGSPGPSRAAKARERGWAVLRLESIDELAPTDIAFAPDARPRAAALLRAHPDRERRPRLWIAADAFDDKLEQERWRVVIARDGPSLLARPLSRDATGAPGSRREQQL